MAVSVDRLPIAPGDWLPPFALRNCQGAMEALLDWVGQPIVLLAWASDTQPNGHTLLAALAEFLPHFRRRNIKVATITLDAPRVRQVSADAWATATNAQPLGDLLCDPGGQALKQYGIYRQLPNDQGVVFSVCRCAILLAPNLQIVEIYSLANLEQLSQTFAEILQAAEQRFPPLVSQPLWNHAPVLCVPHVLSREDCAGLIRLWHEAGNEESGFMIQQGSKTVLATDDRHKIRRDHFISDPTWLERLDRAIQRRVIPQVAKAFHFQITEREDYRIGCYDGDRGGFFGAHRDNTTRGTAHRRFAMTLNLNSEAYDGGELRFPEYGPYLYRPETGSAVIFSCSLMHEALPVRQGRRFGLFSFTYGAAQAAERAAYLGQTGRGQDARATDN